MNLSGARWEDLGSTHLVEEDDRVAVLFPLRVAGQWREGVVKALNLVPGTGKTRSLVIAYDDGGEEREHIPKKLTKDDALSVERNTAAFARDNKNPALALGRPKTNTRILRRRF